MSVGLRPLRIAFANINCNRRDGAARAMVEVAERLVRRGHSVDVFARTVADMDPGLCRIRKVPGLRWPQIADFLTYYAYANGAIRTESYDIVHSIGCNTKRANVYTIQNIQPAKRRILKEIGADGKVSIARRMTRALYLSATSRIERYLFTRSDGVRRVLLPVSRGVQREVADHYGVSDSDMVVVPNAADTTHFRPLPEDQRTAWRKAAGFDATQVVLIFSGGEWARKGLDLAMRALPQLPRHAVLFVAGTDSDKTRFVDLARQLGVRDRVVFGGFRKDIATAMAASDVFVFPSWYEAFSLATIEAAACGLPIVASRINGAEDFVEDGVNGNFVEHSPEAIAAALLPLVRHEDVRRRMGSSARALVLAKYTWDRVTDLTEEVYQTFADRNSA